MNYSKGKFIFSPYLNKKMSIYRNVFFYFHAVFRHAIDVLVVLLVTPSMPFHSPGLQHHFLNLTFKQNTVNQRVQQHNNLEKSGAESRVLGFSASIPGMNMGGTLVSYWWVLGFQKAVRHTDTTDWCVLGQWRVTATMSASTWSTYTCRGGGTKQTGEDGDHQQWDVTITAQCPEICDNSWKRRR